MNDGQYPVDCHDTDLECFSGQARADYDATAIQGFDLGSPSDLISNGQAGGAITFTAINATSGSYALTGGNLAAHSGTCTLEAWH